MSGLRVRLAHGAARRHASRPPGVGHGRRLQPAPPTTRHREPRRPRALLRGRGLGVWFVARRCRATHHSITTPAQGFSSELMHAITSVRMSALLQLPLHLHPKAHSKDTLRSCSCLFQSPPQSAPQFFCAQLPSLTLRLVSHLPLSSESVLSRCVVPYFTLFRAGSPCEVLWSKMDTKPDRRWSSAGQRRTRL